MTSPFLAGLLTSTFRVVFRPATTRYLVITNQTESGDGNYHCACKFTVFTLAFVNSRAPCKTFLVVAFVYLLSEFPLAKKERSSNLRLQGTARRFIRV